MQKPAAPPDFDFDFAPEQLSFDVDFDAGPVAGGLDALPIGKRERIVTKAKARRFYDLSRVPNAAALLGDLPRAGETVHAIMAGDFHAWDLVPAICRMMGEPVDLTLATLGFNLANNGNLCDMIDAGTVRRVTVLCSHFFAKADPHVYEIAKEKLEARGQRILATRNHAKLLLFAAGRRFYVVEGSANLRSCNNLEQIAVTCDRRLYEFHKGWIERLFA